MFRKILVQLDPARPLLQAPRLAKSLAERFNAELVALYVVDETISHLIGGDVSRAVDMALAAIGEEALDEYQESVGAGVRMTKTIGYGETADVIAKYVIRHGVDLVVTGGFHPSVYQRIPFGSIVNDIIRKAPASVFLRRDNHGDPLLPGRMVVPFDGSVAARRAIHRAAEFAAQYYQVLDIVHVQSKARQRGQQVLADAQELIQKVNIPSETNLLRRRFPFSRAHAVLRHAKANDAKLITLSDKGSRTAFGGLSPVVEKLVVHTDRPLLVIHS